MTGLQLSWACSEYVRHKDGDDNECALVMRVLVKGIGSRNKVSSMQGVKGARKGWSAGWWWWSAAIKVTMKRLKSRKPMRISARASRGARPTTHPYACAWGDSVRPIWLWQRLPAADVWRRTHLPASGTLFRCANSEPGLI